MNILRIQSASLYKKSFKAGLILVGTEEDGEPMFMGTQAQFSKAK
jgi:hypothetical protein